MNDICFFKCFIQFGCVSVHVCVLVNVGVLFKCLFVYGSMCSCDIDVYF